MHQAMIQEHERSTGSWQIEWLTLPRMFELTAGALNNARFLSENLVVEAARMKTNLAATNGLLLAEALNLALAPHVGRVQAKNVIQSAVQTSLVDGRHLVDVVRERIDVDLDWEGLRDEANYLGVSEQLIDRILEAARTSPTG
jgi:3-carboxy-cis,cis-muconate cycloisomerase